MKRRSAANRHEITRKNSKKLFVFIRVCSWLTIVFLFTSCAQKMGVQPNHRPLEASPVFPNDQLARQPVRGTVPSGWTRINQRKIKDENFDENANELPFPLTKEVLERGRERYEIYCAVCHGLAGYGDGSIVRRGFVQPPSLHSERLQNAPLGYFYSVITSGFGAMAGYANQIEPKERWAITAYIRALQVSQNANVEDVPPEKRAELEQEK